MAMGSSSSLVKHVDNLDKSMEQVESLDNLVVCPYYLNILHTYAEMS